MRALVAALGYAGAGVVAGGAGVGSRRANAGVGFGAGSVAAGEAGAGGGAAVTAFLAQPVARIVTAATAMSVPF